MMRRLILACSLTLIAGHAYAVCGSATNGTPHILTYLTQSEFQDGQATGSITPGCVRDLIASVYPDVINLSTLGLPTGGDDTAAINAALASAVPATFTGTGSIAARVLTVTGSPGGTIKIGATLSAGTNVTPGSFITSLGTGTGGAGTYNLNIASTAASTTITFQPEATSAVYAPCGVYNHATEINIIGVTLYGDGPCTNFVSTNVSTAEHNAMQLQGTHPQLRDMAVSSNWAGARSSQDYGDAVWIGNDGGIVAVDFLVENITIRRAATSGIDVYSAFQGRVLNNNIYDTMADGVTFQSNPTQAQYAVLIQGNKGFNLGDDCFSVDQSTGGQLIYDIRIIGNHCTNTPARGLTLNGGSNVQAIGNVFDGPLSQGIFIGTDSGGFAKSDHFTVADNICNNCGNASFPGLQVVGQTGTPVTDVIVKNNQITGTGVCMVLGGGATGAAGAALVKGVTIEGNHCTGNSSSTGASTGIMVDGATNVTIKDNYISKVANDCIGGLASANLGDLIVEGNTCDAIGGAGGWVIDFQTSGFNYAVIRNNLELNDGQVPGGGLIVMSGIPVAFIDGNVGDSGARTNTISGLTNGHYYNPFGVNTVYNNGIVEGGTKFTASGCSNGTTLGSGTGGRLTLGAVSCTVVVTMNGASGATSPVGWACSVYDQTHPTALISQSASTTTTASFAVAGAPAVISDVVVFKCHPY